MQWFKLPPKIYFEKHATAYLANMPNISRAFIVTDPGMVEHGYVDTVTHYLRKHANDVKVEVSLRLSQIRQMKLCLKVRK